MCGIWTCKHWRWVLTRVDLPSGKSSEVVREGLRLLEQREQEDKAKLEWLRGAAKEGFDDIERGDYVTLRSGKEIDDFIDRLGEEASADVATDRSRG